MSHYSPIELFLIGTGAFILIRAVMGNYARAFERDRRLGKFILTPFKDYTPIQHGEKYTGKDKLFITAGILAQVIILALFIYLISGN